MMVLDEAAKIKNETSNPRYFMVSALCHDFGKPLVTEYNEEKGKIQAHGHDDEGIKPAITFIKRVYNENNMVKYVGNMVQLHMKPIFLVNNNSSKKSYYKMFDESVNPTDLIKLSKCDCLGRTVDKSFDDREKILNRYFADFSIVMSKPYVSGKDLINEGYKPGPEFEEILNYAHKCRLSEIDKDTVMKQIKGQYKNFSKCTSDNFEIIEETDEKLF